MIDIPEKPRKRRRRKEETEAVPVDPIEMYISLSFSLFLPFSLLLCASHLLLCRTFTRDAALDVFHAVAKVLHNKRTHSCTCTCGKQRTCTSICDWLPNSFQVSNRTNSIRAECRRPLPRSSSTNSVLTLSLLFPASMPYISMQVSEKNCSGYFCRKTTCPSSLR